MIKKLIAVSFLLSLIYAIYKIPSYDNPISDLIFNIFGWLIPIFLVLFSLNFAYSWSMKLEFPFEKAFNLTTRILILVRNFLFQITLLDALLSVYGLLLLFGWLKEDSLGFGLIAILAPIALVYFIITLCLLHIDIKLLKKRTKVGYYITYPIACLIYMIPPLPFLIWWFLIKYRKEYFAVVEKDQQKSPPPSNS